MTKVKICGIRTLHEALAAAEAGADLLGFNFYPGSVRFVDVKTCMQITSALRRELASMQFVGVFVNAPLEEINSTLEACTLDLAQLSGDETPAFRAELGEKAFKSFHGIPAANEKLAVRSGAPAFMIDGSQGGSYGGTGVVADWAAAAALARDYPILLAGGLKPENAATAVRQVRPWGVDVASGVESAPGQKDAGRMQAFIEAVRLADAEFVVESSGRLEK